MSVVFKIGIAEKNNIKIENKETIEVIASKGIIGDRYFKDFNGDREQITLIESENIDYYNKTFNTEFDYLDGVTSNIQTQLNNGVTTGKSIAMAMVFGWLGGKQWQIQI